MSTADSQLKLKFYMLYFFTIFYKFSTAFQTLILPFSHFIFHKFIKLIGLIFTLFLFNVKIISKERDFMTRDKAQVSKTMSHIRGKDTSIEIKLRKALWQEGIRYRKNYRKLPVLLTLLLPNTKLLYFVIVNFFMGKIGKF